MFFKTTFGPRRWSKILPLVNWEAFNAVSLEPSPVNDVAVMAPAAKLPAPSRRTMVFGWLALVPVPAIVSEFSPGSRITVTPSPPLIVTASVSSLRLVTTAPGARAAAVTARALKCELPMAPGRTPPARVANTAAGTTGRLCRSATGVKAAAEPWRRTATAIHRGWPSRAPAPKSSSTVKSPLATTTPVGVANVSAEAVRPPWRLSQSVK